AIRRRSRAGLRSVSMKTGTPERVDLPVSGMTCAACARTIQRTLTRTPGVEAARVNFATHTATVEYDPARTQVDQLIGAIEKLGYGVPQHEMMQHGEEPGLRNRLIVAVLFAVPVMVLGMMHRSPALQLALSLPVVLYAGAPFYIGAWQGLRHKSANMN